MGRRGPAPKPRALKLIQGTYRKDRDNPDQPVAPVEVPTVPAWLSKDAKAEWKRVVPLLEAMNVISLVSRAALVAYCESWDRYRRAVEHLDEFGETQYNAKTGVEVASPWVAIAGQAKRDMRAFLQEFGMTPASATRVRVPKSEPKANPFTDL